MVEFTRQVYKIGGVSLGVVIPAELVDLLKLSDGDYIKVIVEKVNADDQRKD